MEFVHRRRIARRIQWASDILHYVERFVDLPSINVIQNSFDPERDGFAEIEAIAAELREFWKLGVGPVGNLANVLESNGIAIVREPVACADMDGVSAWVGGRPYILLSGEIESGPRDLFNLAHELGHVILHAGVDVTSDNLKLIEKQANRFASAFLLPELAMRREVFGASLDHLTSVKQRWGVAISAIAYRCRDLGIISQDQHERLMRKMNALGIRKREPLDEVFPVSRPSMLRQAIEMLVEHGVQSRNQIESAVGLNLKDVEKLAGLAPGYLDTRVVRLNFRSDYDTGL
jgi:Zn-dependent peptidase ImmA (M78 family)